MFNFDKYHIFDGGMGTMLQANGLPTGGKPEEFNMTHGDTVRAIHRAYVEAGADIITTNTFGASRHKLGCDPAPYIRNAVCLARESGAKYVALDIGPTGAMLEPMGTMRFHDAYELFAEQIRAGVKEGPDLILIETMSDLLETKAALLAAKDICDLPVCVTMTFGADGRTFLGTEPATAAVTLTSLGADAVGINCSLGPKELLPMVQQMAAVTHIPLLVQPNAGIPRMVGDTTVFDVTPEEFASHADAFWQAGVAIMGGCCGTTPDHIRALKATVPAGTPAKREKDGVCRVCGWQKVVELDLTSVAVIGERINPTGRKLLQEALRSKDYSYAAELAIEQQEEGAQLLLINAGLPDINEWEALPKLVQAVQKVSPLPLVIDSSDPIALDRALRVYSGRPILNSVNGSFDSMSSILPIAAQYGAAVVALALDDNGISNKAADRFAVAERIVRSAEGLGIPREDFFIDCLTMAASVSQNEVMETVEAVRLCRAAGLKTILGVSNVSHGLPDRKGLNCAFLSMALSAGLNLPIINPASAQAMETVAAARVLLGLDKGAAAYIDAYSGITAQTAPAGAEATLQSLIISGRKREVPALTEALLSSRTALEVINGEIVPALDLVGEAYGSGKLFLPQLMRSAEAVKEAFDVINRHQGEGAGSNGTIILATVKGDIHDIGKNIVKMLLENYGYRIVDLGRDVSPEEVVAAQLKENAPLVGLSSLMTTTAQNIAATIRALKDAGCTCKVMVGGAVVTQEFADQIGADFYGKDAMESARYAATVFGQEL